jgi:DNA-binding MarR family transcriptional regulator
MVNQKMKTSLDISRMLHRIPCTMEKFENKILQERLNISFSQFRILTAIGQESVSQCSIARYWDITEAAVSRQITNLVDIGLLTRIENPENRREKMLSLSEKGKEVLKKCFHILDEEYEHVFEKFTDEEKQSLKLNLQNIHDSLLND